MMSNNNNIGQNLFDFVYNTTKDLSFDVSFSREELDFIADLIRKDYNAKYGAIIKVDSFEFKLCNKLMSSYISKQLEVLKNEKSL